MSTVKCYIKSNAKKRDRFMRQKRFHGNNRRKEISKYVINNSKLWYTILLKKKNLRNQ